MRAWRIARERFALDRSGAGGLAEAGRWHPWGVPVIHAGMTVEICVLEKLVHTGPYLPADLVLVEMTLPDETTLYEVAEKTSPPKAWDATPSQAVSMKFGGDFLRSARALGLIVPSAIVPEALNLVVNPRHSRFGEVTMRIVRPFTFDKRLRK